jgi:hypothetical protein
MNLPRSVADVLDDHVVFEVDCIDRMYCNVYIPGPQYAAGLVGYVHRQLGLPIASTAPIAKTSDRFTAAVHRFARDQDVPWVDFVRGQRKDDVMHEHLGRRPVRSAISLRLSGLRCAPTTSRRAMTRATDKLKSVAVVMAPTRGRFSWS